MARHDHTLARQLVQGAMERFTGVPRQEHEGDALLIVMGAVLEEVSNGRPSNGVITISISKKVGAAIARAARERQIERVVFNRNGFLFHGRVKALADAAREAGLQF